MSLRSAVRKIAGRIRPAVRISVRQRHIPHAQRIEIPQQTGIVFHRMAAFNSDQRRDFPLPVRGFDSCRRGRK